MNDWISSESIINESMTTEQRTNQFITVIWWISEPMNEWIVDSAQQWTNDLVNESIKQWINKTHDSMNQWSNESMIQRISKSMKQWPNAWMNGWNDAWVDFFELLRHLTTSSLRYLFFQLLLCWTKLVLLEFLQKTFSSRSCDDAFSKPLLQSRMA